MMKVRTHHLAVVIFALLCIPFIASAWIASQHLSSWDDYRPWLIVSAQSEIPKGAWNLSWQIGMVGSLAVGALLLWLFEGVILGVNSSDIHGSTKWATIPEIKDAELMQHWGAVIGRIKGKTGSQIMRTNSPDFSNILVSAPPRSGKGVGVIIPTLLEYPGSVMIYDVKGENYDHTARHRAKMRDKILVFSPFDTRLESDHKIYGKSHGFNPLAVIARSPDIEERITSIEILADSLLSVSGDKEKGLLSTGREIFKAVCNIVCAEEENPTLGRVVDLLTPTANPNGEVADLQKHFAELALRAPEPLSENALAAASANKNENIALYLSVLFDAGLKAWRNPLIRRATEENHFDFETLRSVPQSIYIIIPTPYKETAQPVVRLFFQFALKTIQMSLPNKAREPLDVLFIIDEFHSLGYMKEVLDAPTRIPGYGGRIMTIVQAPASLDEIYGRDAARIFLDITQLKIFMSPNDNQTRRMVEESIGYTTKVSRSVSGKGIGSGDRNSSSYSEIKRPLMSADEIGKMPKTKQVITVQGRSPIYADRIRFYEDPHYKKIYDKQVHYEWPTDDIPVTKRGMITRREDFLASPNKPLPSASTNGAGSYISNQSEENNVEKKASPPVQDNRTDDDKKSATEHSVTQTVTSNSVKAEDEQKVDNPSEENEPVQDSPSAQIKTEAVKEADQDLNQENELEDDQAAQENKSKNLASIFDSDPEKNDIQTQMDKELEAVFLKNQSQSGLMASCEAEVTGNTDDSVITKTIRSISPENLAFSLSQIPNEVFQNAPLTSNERDEFDALSVS